MTDTPDPYKLLERLEAEAKEADEKPDLTNEQAEVLLAEVAKQAKRLSRANQRLLKVSEQYGEVLLSAWEVGVRYTDLARVSGKAEQTMDHQLNQAKKRRKRRAEGDAS